MPTRSFELAQLNVGRLVAPLDDERIAGFVAALDPVNALADSAPGFVWRMQTEDGNNTAVRPTDDPMLLINLSVWASLEELAAFVFEGMHRDVLRERRQWFETALEPIFALWWVPTGHRPGTDEAFDRIGRLRRDGPTPSAFTFRRSFGPPDGRLPGGPAADRSRGDDAHLECPA